MKLLILVISGGAPIYDKFMRASHETWASVQHPNVDQVFFCAPGSNNFIGDIFYGDCPPEQEYSHWKHKLALDAVWDWDWDILVRTNANAYIHKENLYQFAKNLPLDKVHGGWSLGIFDNVEWRGHTFKQWCVSTACAFFSRDCIDVLRKNIPCEADIPNEDVVIGRVLSIAGIPMSFDDRTICHLEYNMRNFTPSAYAYRLKTGRPREQDIELMYRLHERIHGRNRT